MSGHSGLGGDMPLSLPPGAAALLPPQAVAAYLNAAAAAAAEQQRRLLMGSNLSRERSTSPNDNDEPILDYSKKRKSSFDQSDSNDENLSDNEGLSKEGTPLDLSVSRKRGGSDSPRHAHNKIPRPGQDFKQSIVTPWSSSQLPFFAAAAAAAGFSPKALANEWNGRNKMHSLPSDATKALEKMSELSRLGEDIFRASNTNSTHVGGGNSGNNTGSNSSSVSVGATTGRHSAWQSHWLNKGADTTKDVLKCVWCKQSFPTLDAMTTHMKETKHCGVNVPPHTSSQPSQPPSREVRETSSNSHHQQSKSDLNLLIKETMPLPRKLVRGQDVWLGKGAEQTRQILKCMWCGQSFRSLSEMTQHMQETQHYTNIISQEQIISWKTGSGPNPGQSNSASGGGRGENTSSSNSSNNGREGRETREQREESNANEKSPSTPSPSLASSMNNSHVSAVLTCKVCDQAFTSLKELSNHMVKNAHYKEHIMRSITESSGSRRRQTKEKRKKSLPVRKLLELERAQNDFKNGDNVLLNKPLKDISTGRITCEKCGDKIEMANFVDHIRQCIGSSLSPSQKLKSALLTNTIIPPDSVSPIIVASSRDGQKSDSDLTSPNSLHQRSPSNSLDISNKSSSSIKDKTSSPSVLNAIEQLIEKSFDSRPRHSSTNQAPLNHGSSILKRLGIDENIDYTKPLVDAQTMNLLRSYHSQQVYLASSHFNQRERSGSESSSISERGSSRVDSLTPEKKTANDENNDIEESVNLKIKREYSDDVDEKQDMLKKSKNVKIKCEMNEDESNDARNASRESANRANETDDDEDDKPLRLIRPIKNESRDERESPISPAERRSSPASDRQSVKSNESSKKSISSLGALSSMFDSLNQQNNSSSDKTSAENGGGAKKAHPLAALQKLCDGNKRNENSPITRSGSASQTQALSASVNNRSTSGSMLNFSWACNDGIITDDMNIKCAFCDTVFSSKGSYRHHLSKMHFVCDDALTESIVLKSSGNGSKNLSLPARPPSHSSPTPPSKSPISMSPKSNVSDINRVDSNDLTSLKKSPSPVRTQSSNERHNKSEASATSSSSSSATVFDESPHSKFLKYTELAKQLSSKYV